MAASAFKSTLQPDAPLIQSARTSFDAAAWQKLDTQVVACELFLALALLNGVTATYCTIDNGSGTVAKGDVLCRSTATTLTLTLATGAALTAANGVYGVALEAASPGARCLVALAGAISPDVTGLGQTSGFARVTSNRAQRVASLGSGDYALGSVDSAGWLVLQLQTGAVGAAAGGITLSSSTPAAVAGSGSAGAAGTASRSDHVHAHGTGHSDGTAHNLATGLAPGFYPSEHFTAVGNRTHIATINAIVARSTEAESHFGWVGIGSDGTGDGISESGLLRLPQVTPMVTMRNAGDTDDILIISGDSNSITVGDGNNATAVSLVGATSVLVKIASSTIIDVSSSAISVETIPITNAVSLRGKNAATSADPGEDLLLGGGDAGDTDQKNGNTVIRLGAEDDDDALSAELIIETSPGNAVASFQSESGAVQLSATTALSVLSGGLTATFDNDGLALLGKALFLGEITPPSAPASGTYITANSGQVRFVQQSPPTAYTQTYNTTTRTFSAYTPDDESVAYTGQDNAQAGTVYAKFADLQALRVAYENLRAHAEEQGKLINSLIDDLQAYKLAQ